MALGARAAFTQSGNRTSLAHKRTRSGGSSNSIAKRELLDATLAGVLAVQPFQPFQPFSAPRESSRARRRGACAAPRRARRRSPAAIAAASSPCSRIAAFARARPSGRWRAAMRRWRSRSESYRASRISLPVPATSVRWNARSASTNSVPISRPAWAATDAASAAGDVARVLDDALDRVALDHPAGLHHGLGLGGGDRDDQRAALRVQAQQALGLELAERGAHRGAAHARAPRRSRPR